MRVFNVCSNGGRITVLLYVKVNTYIRSLTIRYGYFFGIVLGRRKRRGFLKVVFLNLKIILVFFNVLSYIPISTSSFEKTGKTITTIQINSNCYFCFFFCPEKGLIFEGVFFFFENMFKNRFFLSSDYLH